MLLFGVRSHTEVSEVSEVLPEAGGVCDRGADVSDTHRCLGFCWKPVGCVIGVQMSAVPTSV